MLFRSAWAERYAQNHVSATMVDVLKHTGKELTPEQQGHVVETIGDFLLGSR